MKLTEKEIFKLNKSVDIKNKKWIKTSGINNEGNFYKF